MINELCNREECEYKKLCKYSEVKDHIKCPVFIYSKTRKWNVPEGDRHISSLFISMKSDVCPSCKQNRSPMDMYGDRIWGMICGHCLYELKIKGYPVNQHLKLLKDRKLNLREDLGKAWDISDAE